MKALRIRVATRAWLVALLYLPAPLCAAADGKDYPTVGPNACAECHTQETRIWKKTHHYLTFRAMPRSKDARKIAKRLNIRRIKSDPMCKSCHFTEELIGGRKRITAGISCESCHGGGRDWIKIHSSFSGKGSKTAESGTERAARWKAAEARGMIRPKALYDLARNCYSCHVVPREKLVNIGQHPAGSKFNLVSWSQGEVRHNTWYSKGKSNVPSGRNRLRMMYAVGLAVELETALRAVAEATKPKAYAIRMAHRANDARNKLAELVKAASNVPELKTILLLSHSAGLKLNNKQALTQAADKIAVEGRRLAANYDGKALAGIDPLLPKPETYRGKNPG